MRVPSSVKLVVATWLAALIGALAGRSLAVAEAAPRGDVGIHEQETQANVVVTKSVAVINRH